MNSGRRFGVVDSIVGIVTQALFLAIALIIYFVFMGFYVFGHENHINANARVLTLLIFTIIGGIIIPSLVLYIVH